MSTTIDERVVEMRFDHSNFKKNAGETVNLLEKLKNALNFSSSNNGLDELNKSARRVDLNPLAKSVETVRQNFTAMEVAAVAALVNITNRAVDAGVQLVKSLSIDQVTAGWDKYAQKTSAVQTIMAATAQDFTNTGEQMEYVNSQLERLNWFTDETSYNFVDMVGNIGKFTANNIALDKSATAMQGIATWAAVSGAKTEEASRAMYNLAQAVAVGSVKLIDWKSIENANMATAEFKKTALETASSMGLLRKQANGVYRTIGKGTQVTIANFNSALSEGWFTSKVLLGTLDKYGAFTNVLYEVSDATGLTATELLTWMDKYRGAGENTEEVLQNMAAAASDSGITVKELSSFMKELTSDTYELGEKAFRAAQEAKTFEEAITATKDAVSTGWMNTWEIIFGDYEQAKEIWTGLANELYDVFAAGAERRNALLEEALGLPEKYLDQSTSSWNNLVKQVETAGVAGEKFANQCYEVAKQLGILDEWSLTSFDDFRKSLENGWFTSDTLITTLNSMMGPFANASAVVKDASHTFEDFQDVLGKLNRGELGKGDELLRNLAESGWNVVAMQEAANKLLSQGEVTMDDYNAALEEMTILQYKDLGYSKNTIQNLKRLRDAYSDTTLTIIDDGDAISKWWTGTELLFTGIAQAWNAIKNIFSAIGKGWEIAFPPMTAERLYNILGAFMNLTMAFNRGVGEFLDDGESFTGLVGDIRDGAAGLASVFGLISDVIKEIGSYAFNAFGGSLANGIKKVLNYAGSIGRLLVAFRDWVKENKIIRTGIENVVSWVSQGATAVRGWVESFSELPWVQSIIEGIQSGVQQFVTLIRNSFPRVSSLVGNLWSRFKAFANDKDFNGIVNLVKELAKALKDDLADAFGSIDGRFPTITELFTKIANSIKNLNVTSFPKWAQGLYNVASALLVPVISIFLSFVNMLKNVAEGADNAFDFMIDITGRFGKAITENLGSIIAAFLMYKVGSTLANFAKSLWSVINLIESPIKALVGAFNGFKNAAKSLGHAFDAFAVVEVALAIGILGYTLIKLGEMNEADLKKAGSIMLLLSIVAATLMGVAWVLSDNKGLDSAAKNVKFKGNAALNLIALAGSIYLIVVAFKKLLDITKGVNFDDAMPPLIAIISIIGVLTVLALAIDGVGQGVGIGGAVSILSLAASVHIIVSVLDDILKFITAATPDQFYKTVGTLIWIVGMLSVLMLGLQGLNLNGWNAAGLLAVGFAVKILAGVLNDILKFVTTASPDQFYQTISTLIWIVALLAVLMLGLSTIGDGSRDVGVGLLAASAGIWILVSVIKRLSSMTASDIFKGVIAIGALMIFMGLMTRLANGAKSFDSLKAGAAFLAISASLLILVGAIALMTLMDPGRLMNATVAMSMLMVAFGILLACASLVKDVKPAYFVSLAVVLTVLAGSVILLGSMDPESVLIGVAAMTAMMTAMGLMMVMARLIKNVKVGPLLTLGIIVSVLAGALIILASLDNPAGIIVATSALVAAMNAFSTMFLVIGIATRIAGQFSKTAIVALVAIGAIVVALALVIGYLVEKIGPDGVGTAIAITGSLTALMLGLAVVMKAVSSLGKLKLSELGVGILGAIAVLALIITLAAVLGEINEANPKISEAIEKSFPLLRNVGRAIGEVAGGFVDGLLGINTGGLADKLVSFGEAVSSFVEQIRGIDDSAVSAVKSVVELLLAMAGADLISAVTSWFGGDTTSLTAFGEELVVFGPMLAAFSDSVSGGKIDPEAIQASADAAKSLNDLAKNLPRSGGFVGTLIGDRQGLDEFGSGILVFGDALVGYSAALSAGTSFDPDLIERSAEAASSLVKLQNELPTLNGWAQKIIGQPQSLQDFGEGLKTFGSSLVGYSGELANVKNWSLFDTAVTATQSIVELSGKLGKDDGWINKIFGGGQTDLAEFGSTLKKFAQGLVDYSTTAVNINTSGLDNAQKVVDYLLGIASGDSTKNAKKLEDVGKYVSTLGSDLYTYYGYASQIDATALSTTISAISGLVSLIHEMDGITAKSTSGFTSALTSLAKVSLDDFCAVFENSADRITAAINIVAINASVAALNSSPDFVTAGVYSVTAYLNGLVSDEADFNGAAKTMAKKVLDVLNASVGDFEAVGKLLTTNYTNGLTFDMLGLFYTGVDLSNQALLGMAAPSVEIDAYTLGRNFAVGFHNGMVSGNSLVGNAAYTLGRIAVNNLQAAIDAHSPAKETEALGGFAGLGFVNGILSYLQKAADAGEELGLAPLDNLKAAIQNVPYLLANDINLNPVIRPVIDLDGARESATTLNGMFNRSIGMSAALAGATGGAFERARSGSTSSSVEKDVNSTSDTPKYQVTQHNTFYITSNDPEAVAEAVSYRLQKQVERKESTWAQSSGTGYPRVRSRS